MLEELVDDRGRPVGRRPPARIVSLVPSDTYTLLRLGAAERLVGRTRFCVEPEALVRAVPDVGGTKDPDVDKILDLAPDLVVMNQEENTRRDAARLEAAGVTVFVTFPKRVAAGAAQVARLARVLGDAGQPAKDLVRFAYEAVRAAAADRRARPAVPTFVPIWADPLMTIHGDTFISDVLDHVGAANVFADRARKFPLAADLGRASELAPERAAGRDTRYPRVTLDEVAARRPDLVLLPDEPHPFSDADADVFRALDIPAAKSGRILFCPGKHLMWPGLMSLEGLERLAAMVRGTRLG
jgi:ABC-type Fe3+-hydroxamate transport system substrate-binding protein